jgi:abortive infection bacteriophage resistance protein
MKFDKPALTTPDHILLLRNRGLEILNENLLSKAIDEIGFFRLLGYMYPFQKDADSHEFGKGTSDNDILNCYKFDKRLRRILLEAIETLEVAIKASICNITTISFGPHWYTDHLRFHERDNHQKLIDFISESSKESSEHFIRRYRESYHIPTLPPLWMVMELLTFGKLCSLYGNMKDSSEKKDIAARFGLPVTIFSSWLLSINYVRNCCAHHNRIWNRWLPLRPTIPTGRRFKFLNMMDSETDKRIFGILSCMLYLLKTIGEDGDLRNNIKSLFDQYPEINKSYMGFHPAWADEPIWQ